MKQGGAPPYLLSEPLPGCAHTCDARAFSLETHLATTLPLLITTGLATMAAKGVEATQLDAVKTRLDAGDVKGAAILYDAAVRGTEGP